MFGQLQDMALFALVVECGSFTAAARRAGLPKSSVSLRVSQLEKQLGLRLLNRTTRQLSLTFAGERYLVHCREMVQAAERADLSLQRLRDNPSGRLRVTAPAGIAATLLAPLCSNFRLSYPEVSLEIYVSDQISDLVQEGFDVAFRTGKPQDSSLVGRRLGYSPRSLLASPDYMQHHAPLTHPRQLEQHACIAHRAWHEWILQRGGEFYRWELPMTHAADSLLYVRECVLAGAGITLLPAYLSQELVGQGRLLTVLPGWEAEGNELYLVYPSRKLNSPALDRFIEMALSRDAFMAYRQALRD
ncbi:LysR family transcriptional regulator [Enterobacillus tribolii]|uniref:LysR family transcriptional regulator n=1 Tax=Enterobacillus tribolii TaxID=1487935 RepID=A0A370QQ70_9GAMM|nr:LysR family transcriptional regulator [Enterobacillus tribolii]MBW7981533.1 LysR family transcriptional regulator [Enterobacillus tribolii]RDK90910.1 LysR family transcriptional regulator [Enterobacillus tribolii]